MDRFKVGDIVICTVLDLGNILITSCEKDYYRATIITGYHDGTKIRIHDHARLKKVGNIYELRKDGGK